MPNYMTGVRGARKMPTQQSQLDQFMTGQGAQRDPYTNAPMEDPYKTGAGSRRGSWSLQDWIDATKFDRGIRDPNTGALFTGTPEEWYQNPANTVAHRHEMGMAGFYDDSYAQLVKSMQSGESVDQALQRIMENFKGSPGDLQDFLSSIGPQMGSLAAGQLRGTDAFKYMQDQGNWDLGAMSGYGTAAGMLGQQARAGIQQGANSLAASGLGRSGAQSALRQQAMMGLGGQQASLWSQAYQQSMQNRMASAGNALDAHRQLAQIALGQQMTPRVSDSGNQWGNAFTGAAQGATAGAAIGGPWGGLAGAGLGAVSSLFGGKK